MSIPNLQQFENHQQEPFTIHFNTENPGVCRVKEISVSKSPAKRDGGKQFSVVFTHPDPTVYEQGLYPVSHPELGEFELFLVPIYGDKSEVDYEAVFS